MRDAAKAEPEKFGKLQADMDRTGRVDGPFNQLRVIRQSEAIRKEPPSLPGHGPYRVIIVDPPWPYEIRMEDPSHRGVHPYSTMSIEQIVPSMFQALRTKIASSGYGRQTTTCERHSRRSTLGGLPKRRS